MRKIHLRAHDSELNSLLLLQALISSGLVFQPQESLHRLKKLRTVFVISERILKVFASFGRRKSK